VGDYALEDDALAGEAVDLEANAGSRFADGKQRRRLKAGNHRPMACGFSRFASTLA